VLQVTVTDEVVEMARERTWWDLDKDWAASYAQRHGLGWVRPSELADYCEEDEWRKLRAAWRQHQLREREDVAFDNKQIAQLRRVCREHGLSFQMVIAATSMQVAEHPEQYAFAKRAGAAGGDAGGGGASAVPASDK
jgi:hypothetical protein